MPRGQYPRIHQTRRRRDLSRPEASHAKLTPLDDPDFDPMLTDRERTRALEAKLDFRRHNLRIR